MKPNVREELSRNCVIKIVRVAGLDITTGHEGEYLVNFTDTPDGNGIIKTTPQIESAKVFGDAVQALAYWKQQSKHVPLRPDGKPNRPLTAFTVEIV